MKTRKANPWEKVIADKMKQSPDGVARLDVSKDDLAPLLKYLSAENNARRIHSHSTTGCDLPSMKKGKLTRVAVYPAGWKTTAKPTCSKLFESEAEAVKHLQAQRRKGALVRMVNEADQYLNEVFGSIDEPARHKALMRQATKISTRRWIVQTWEPGSLLKHLATDYSEAELIGAAMAGISVARRMRWRNTDNAPKGGKARGIKIFGRTNEQILNAFAEYKRTPSNRGHFYATAETNLYKKLGYKGDSPRCLGKRLQRITNKPNAEFFNSLPSV